MKTRDEVIQILTTVKPELEKRYKIKRVALFGAFLIDDGDAEK